MTKVKYAALLEHKDGEYQLTFPDVLDASARGETKDDALENAKLALAITLNDMITHYESLPQARSLADLQRRYGGKEIINVEVDLDAY
ncbi:type II toxin-antitoxin system HicB family antitoxin [Limosilactobacillus difficilis]|uniref:type II toxin-antitoxin system HicB family antitoxin n=1 Tax=Limosilactobacillus difficilis TaxID=2991838 RepID=UPI0024B9C111|nr:type II toxin-antitoxin system HicB family antitoxin [Limosilactobacillus difficilis]